MVRYSSSVFEGLGDEGPGGVVAIGVVVGAVPCLVGGEVTT